MAVNKRAALAPLAVLLLAVAAQLVRHGTAPPPHGARLHEEAHTSNVTKKCQPWTVPPQYRCEYVKDHRDVCYPEGGMLSYLRVHYCIFSHAQVRDNRCLTQDALQINNVLLNGARYGPEIVANGDGCCPCHLHAQPCYDLRRHSAKLACTAARIACLIQSICIHLRYVSTGPVAVAGSPLRGAAVWPDADSSCVSLPTLFRFFLCLVFSRRFRCFWWPFSWRCSLASC